MDWRDMTSFERELLEKLLAVEFPGREAVASQLAGARVRPLDDGGSIAFHAPRGERAAVKRRIPIEAQVADEDGVLVHALLHVVDGMVKELEIYKDDSSAILKLAPASKWEVLLLGGGGDP